MFFKTRWGCQPHAQPPAILEDRYFYGNTTFNKKHKKRNCKNKKYTNEHITLERFSKKEKTILGGENNKLPRLSKEKVSRDRPRWPKSFRVD